MQAVSFADCRFRVRDREFVLENSRISRAWRLVDGMLRSVSVRDRVAGREFLRERGPWPAAFLYEGYFPAHRPLQLFHPLSLVAARARPVKKSLFAGAHLEATLEFVEPRQGLALKMVHWIFPGVAAIRSWLEIKVDNYPKGNFHFPDPLRAGEALALDRRLAEVEVHRFLCRTDQNRDGLRFVHRGRLERKVRRYDGSLALVSDRRGRGLFLLKEHPPREEQQPEVTSDFRVGDGQLLAMGWGIMPWEFRPDRFRRTWSWTVGVFAGGTLGAARELRGYQDARYVRRPKMDDQFMANCFGNNRWGDNLTEGFLLRELKAAAAAGIEIYQPDDGWQQGHPRGNLNRVRQNLILPPGAWNFHSRRFPRGFTRVAREARRLGVRLGLWYSPDLHRQYRHWKREADFLLSLWRRHGVEFFKIDTVQLRSKDAEENFTAFLERLRRLSRGRVTTNLDVTAGWRWGYFQNAEYGNFFLENRLTGKGTYWPRDTLRNLWQLSLFVPTRQLQIEIPDVDTGRENYSRRDPTRPEAAGQAYAGAVALFACPLFWGEAAALSPAGRAALKAVTGLWKKLRREIYAGQVWPLGEEPNGRTFTGFQSAREGRRGLAIFYREQHRDARREFPLYHLPPGRYRVAPVWPPGEARTVRFGRSARLAVEFDRPHDFRIIRYAPEA